MTESSTTPTPIRRAAIANLGCKVNQAEMAALERLLREAGVRLVDVREAADLVVINTCTVTSMADAKSRQQLRRARRRNPEAQVLVTGCAVSVEPEMLAAADPAARLYDNEWKGRLLSEMTELLGLPDGVAWPTLSGVDAAIADTGEASAEEAADRTRAFVKIQDGCSFHCTYCIIPRARGSERSLAADAVVEDVKLALDSGRREIVLTGINVGSYSDRGLGLAGLVARLLAETNVERIRLSSVEPQHVGDELLAVWAGSDGRCLPHFHIPLQSGDDTILRRMGRRYDTAAYARVVARVREAVPGAAVHADLIAGFPGEDDAAWARTLEFVSGLALAGVHVFRYSSRPGTPAARMAGQVDTATRKRRAAEALALAAQARARFALSLVGGEMRVLFETQLADGRWLGHAESHVLVAADSPDGGPLHKVLAVVRAESVDPEAPDRIRGRLIAVEPPLVPPTLPPVAVDSPISRQTLAESADT